MDTCVCNEFKEHDPPIKFVQRSKVSLRCEGSEKKAVEVRTAIEKRCIKGNTNNNDSKDKGFTESQINALNNFATAENSSHVPRWPEIVLSTGNCIRKARLRTLVHPPLLHFEDTHKTKIEASNIKQRNIFTRLMKEDFLTLMQLHYSELEKNAEIKTKAVNVEVNQCSGKIDFLNLYLRRKIVTNDMSCKRSLEFDPLSVSISSCSQVCANSEETINGPGINMFLQPHEVLSDEKCNQLNKCYKEFAAIEHRNLDNQEQGTIRELVKSTGNGFNAQFAQCSNFSLQSDVKKNTVNPSKVNIYANVCSSNNRAIMMGYPMIETHNQENIERSNSLSSNVKRKRKINTEIGENPTEDLRNREYDLTFNTIEGGKVEMNDLQALHNYLRVPIGNDQSTDLNSEMFPELQENTMKTVDVKSTQDRKIIENLTMHLQLEDAMQTQQRKIHDKLKMQPRPQDILCGQGGRGSKIYNHDGYKWYRSCIANHKVICT